MRTQSLRAALILACAALVVTAVAYQACASLFSLLPADPFIGSRAPQVQQDSYTPHDFFSMALGMIPATDENSSVQMSGLLSIKKKYDESEMELPSTYSGNSMGNNLISFRNSLGFSSMDGSNSTAKSSYESFIKRFPNQSNIFAPYPFAG